MPQHRYTGPHLDHPAYEEITGWPATPGTPRLLDAQSALALDQGQQTGRDQLAPDARMLYLTTAVHNFTMNLQLIQQTARMNSREGFTALMDHAGQADTEHTIGAITFAINPANPDTLEMQHIFALVRDPDWMGASAHLPAMIGKRVTIFESVLLRDRPGLLMARPERAQAHDDPRERPLPTGEAQLLREVLQWHGAISCHWIPGTGQDAHISQRPPPPL